LGCCFLCFSWSGELFEASILSAGESQALGDTSSIRPWCNLIDYADAGGYGLGLRSPHSQSTQSINAVSFWMEFAFISSGRLAVNLIEGIVSTNRSGKMIKPHDVEGQI
jgi:hypothetical protein